MWFAVFFLVGKTKRQTKLQTPWPESHIGERPQWGLQFYFYFLLLSLLLLFGGVCDGTHKTKQNCKPHGQGVRQERGPNGVCSIVFFDFSRFCLDLEITLLLKQIFEVFHRFCDLH